MTPMLLRCERCQYRRPGRRRRFWRLRPWLQWIGPPVLLLAAAGASGWLAGMA